MPRRACVWMSMNPGAITAPCTSMTRVAGSSIDGAIRTMLSPRIATAPRCHGDPVPSMMRPFFSRRSYCADWASNAASPATAATRASGRASRPRREVEIADIDGFYRDRFQVERPVLFMHGLSTSLGQHPAATVCCSDPMSVPEAVHPRSGKEPAHAVRRYCRRELGFAERLADHSIGVEHDLPVVRVRAEGPHTEQRS